MPARPKSVVRVAPLGFPLQGTRTCAKLARSRGTPAAARLVAAGARPQLLAGPARPAAPGFARLASAAPPPRAAGAGAGSEQCRSLTDGAPAQGPQPASGVRGGARLFGGLAPQADGRAPLASSGSWGRLAPVRQRAFLHGTALSTRAAGSDVRPARREASWALPGLARLQGRPGVRKQRLFESHQAARAAAAVCAVEELLAEMPPEAADRVLGERARSQVPDPLRRRELAVAMLRGKAGPKGDRAKRALRSWRLLQTAAAARGLPNGGMPASAALVADICRAELQRAQREARGSQGGNTVGKTVCEGFVWLQSVARLPIDASDPLVEAAAEAEEGDTPNDTRHAGTLPIAVQCAFEAVAAGEEWSVLRFVARSFLCSVFAHHIRCCDALNAVLFADERDPARVIRGRTRVRSKRSPPIQLYAPAAGFLGAWPWVEEHVAELKGLKYCLPAFDAAKAGRPSTATRLLPGAMADRHVLTAFRDVLEHSPFVFPASPQQFYKEWGLTGHSPHSTGSDMARFAGERAGFTETDARELGHWLRDKNAPQADPRRVPGAPQRGQPDGRPCSRGAMSLRYSQGRGRRGEREAQLDVRARLTGLVREALELWGRPWQELPPGTDDWEILRLVWAQGAESVSGRPA